MKPFPSSPLRSPKRKVRLMYPFTIISLLTLLLIAVIFTFSSAAKAAPSSTHVRLSKSTMPNTPPAATKWYIAGGSVGGGFQEYLTIQNPDITTDAAVTISYLLQPTPNPSSNSIHTRLVTHTIPAATRQTIDVDQDLGTTQNGPHTDTAAIVNVTNSVAVIVERPWYFNNLGVNTGTDAFGVTTPQDTYYFAEADSLNAQKSGQPDYNTFVSVLNPSASLTVNATITYYNGSCGGSGQQTCQSQSFTLVPLERVVMKPTIGLGFHAKFSIAVTADNPIVAERLMYVKDNIAKAGGFTTGAIMGPGATSPDTDWLFAEGYTGTGFQEYYEIANFGATTANVRVNLEYTNGYTQAVPVSVAARGKVEFDVNAHRGPTDSVSAEITSDNAVVIERMMYFHFGPHHISGTTDVVGIPSAQVTSQTTYAFAEGYTNGNFNEFLTLQNPNSTSETATVTYYLTSTSFSAQYNLPAHSRTTVNVNNAISSHGGGAVSMLVSASGTFVAERPIYFIYGTAQGGSDVIGFTGS